MLKVTNGLCMNAGIVTRLCKVSSCPGGSL